MNKLTSMIIGGIVLLGLMLLLSATFVVRFRCMQVYGAAERRPEACSGRGRAKEDENEEGHTAAGGARGPERRPRRFGHEPRPQDQAGEVKCYGINGCGSHAKCAVTAADIEAVRALLGVKDFKSRFCKSEAHSCGAHAKCGSGAQILNWVPTSFGECKTQGGILIEEGKDKKKVAKKA